MDPATAEPAAQEPAAPEPDSPEPDSRGPASGDVEPRPVPTPAELRRLDEVFGDVLPITTGDERDDRDPSAGDDDYLANRPPHHDRG